MGQDRRPPGGNCMMKSEDARKTQENRERSRGLGGAI